VDLLRDETKERNVNEEEEDPEREDGDLAGALEEVRDAALGSLVCKRLAV
jgi:hypothetical protein